MHTEPLNAIVGRADLIAAFGVVAAGLLFWRDSAARATRGLRRPIIACSLFTLALLSKENAVTLVGVVLLLDWWRWRQSKATDSSWWLQRVTRAYVPLIVITMVYLGAREAFVPPPDQPIPPTRQQIDNPIATPSLDIEEGDSATIARWATPTATFGIAAKLLLWPTQLCCDYSYKAIETVRRFSDARLMSSIIWAAVAIVGIIISLRRRAHIAVALGITLVTYSIVSNLPVVIGTIFGERLLYLPSVGVCLCIGLLGGWCIETGARRGRVQRSLSVVAICAVTLMAGWYAYLTVQRNRDWKSDERLWIAAEKVNPRSCRVLNHRAQHLLNDGQYEKALQYAQRSIDIAPAHWNAWRTAGVAYRREGNVDKAYEYLQQALTRGGIADDSALLGMVELLVTRSEPERAMELLKEGMTHRPDWRLGRYWQGVLLAQTGRTSDSVAHLQQLVRDYPEWTTIRITLAEILAQLDQTEEAITHLKEILAIEPENRSALIRCAEYQRKLYRYDQAIAYLRKAAQLQPDAVVLNNLASWLISADPESFRNPTEALEHIRTAVSMIPNNSAIIDTHVAVLLALGLREDAINALQRALDVLPDDDALRPALAEQLSSLQGERPSPP